MNIIWWDYPKIIEQIKSLFIFSSQDYTADCLLFGHYLINSMNIVYPRCKIKNKISNKMLWFLAQWCCIHALNFVTNYILDAIISDIFLKFQFLVNLNVDKNWMLLFICVISKKNYVLYWFCVTLFYILDRKSRQWKFYFIYLHFRCQNNMCIYVLIAFTIPVFVHSQ